MKKIISILLIAAMMASFAACAGSKPNEGNETNNAADTQNASGETETTDDNPAPDLPAYNADGPDFTICYRFGAGANDYDDYFIAAEKEDGEVVNDAVFSRNLQTSEKFNVNIVTVPDPSPAGPVRTLVQANDAEYDLAVDSKNMLADLTTSGYLLDFNTLENVDFTKPYWDKNCADELMIGGKLFMMVSDISMQNFSGARFLYFNKKIIEDRNLTNPYDLIFSNGWTLDVVLNMIKSVSDDLDGDGKMTGNDLYGMLREDGSLNGNVIYFLKGCGVYFTSRDEEGMPVVSVNTEKTAKVIEMCHDVLTDNNVTIEYADASNGFNLDGYNHLYEYCRKALFAQNHFLFVQNGLDATAEFRDMESDYGFAPNPKFDDSQENYYHGVDQFTTILGIPATVTDYEKTGIILEYMSWLSSKEVLPAYYEITIKVKRARDPLDAQAADIIKNSIMYEASDIYGWGIEGVIWSSFQKNNFASTYEKKQKMLTKMIEQTIKQFEKIG